MKALVGAFNQEKALVGAFCVIVKTGCGTDGALHSTSYRIQEGGYGRQLTQVGGGVVLRGPGGGHLHALAAAGATPTNLNTQSQAQLQQGSRVHHHTQ